MHHQLKVYLSQAPLCHTAFQQLYKDIYLLTAEIYPALPLLRV